MIRIGCGMRSSIRHPWRCGPGDRHVGGRVSYRSLLFLEHPIDLLSAAGDNDLFCHFIETTEVHAKAEITILFPHEEHRSSVRRTARTYKSNAEMLVQELAQLAEFGLRQGIDRTRWRFSAFHEVDL